MFRERHTFRERPIFCFPRGPEKAGPAGGYCREREVFKPFVTSQRATVTRRHWKDPRFPPGLLLNEEGTEVLSGCDGQMFSKESEGRARMRVRFKTYF